MKLNDLNEWLTLTANVGVLIGIIFLAFEIQQNTSQMRAEAAIGIHQDVQRLNEALYQDEELAALILRGEQDYLCLDPLDQLRVQRFFFSEVNLADLVSSFDEEGLAEISIRIVNILVDQFNSMPGRRQFIDSTIGQGDFISSALRSEELYRNLVSEFDGQANEATRNDC